MIRRILEDFEIKVLLNGTWPASSTPQAYIDMRESDRVMFFASLALTGVDGTVPLVVYQAKDAAGTDAKILVEGGETAQIDDESLVDATTPSGAWVAIEVENRRMDINNGFTHLTVAPAETATGTLTGVILAMRQPRNRPVTQEALCKEIVYFDG